MDNVICKVCSKEFSSDSSLHRHLRLHKLRVEDYYHKHYARLDLYDKSLIKFKNKEQYFDTDFNSRINLKKWINESDSEKVKVYIKNLLEKRRLKKNLTYSPSQVELRSLITPPVKIYNNFFGDYYKLCQDIGFQNRFSKLESEIKSNVNNLNDCFIYIDSREQKPLKFNMQSEVKCLKFGDYALSDKDLTGNCYVERKSVNDLIGTLSGGYERFLRELVRAKEANAYLIILVEESFSNCMSFNYLPHVFQKGTKVTPEYLFHNVREIIQNHEHLQFLFVDGRKEASRVVEKIFSCGHIYKKVDLQYAYDEKML